jgi:glutathione S-transferase
MSDEIDFYMAPQTRAVTVHWMLEEVGAPYRMRVLDLDKGEHKRADFLAINPMGKVPAIVHQGTVVTEVAAICLYLADAFPTSRRRSAIRGAAPTCAGCCSCRAASSLPSWTAGWSGRPGRPGRWATAISTPWSR